MNLNNAKGVNYGSYKLRYKDGAEYAKRMIKLQEHAADLSGGALVHRRPEFERLRAKFCRSDGA